MTQTEMTTQTRTYALVTLSATTTFGPLGWSGDDESDYLVTDRGHLGHGVRVVSGAVKQVSGSKYSIEDGTVLRVDRAGLTDAWADEMREEWEVEVEMHTEQVVRGTGDRTGHEQPATAKQMAFLEDLGADMSVTYTKRGASEMIELLLENE